MAWSRPLALLGQRVTPLPLPFPHRPTELLTPEGFSKITALPWRSCADKSYGAERFMLPLRNECLLEFGLGMG